MRNTMIIDKDLSLVAVIRYEIRNDKDNIVLADFDNLDLAKEVFHKLCHTKTRTAGI